jgi:ABC-type uncharacterized transport system ATPase subunit
MPIRANGVIGRTHEHAAVRHILTSPAIADRTASYIGENDIDWHGLIAEAQSMSGGEQVLVSIAYDLWEPRGIVGVWDIARRLDRPNFERVIEALVLLRGDATRRLQVQDAA